MEKTITKDYKLEFADEDDEQLAEAAISANQSFNYLKFILTDDKPNGNQQRIPRDEFENVIRTGFFTPLKMAEGGIKDGHEDSVPLGVITHLKENDDQIRGLAALWSEERPDDIAIIRKAYAEKNPINISWELAYTNSTFEDDGTENLHGVTLRAATIVGLPAYDEGRTRAIQFASDKEKENKNMEELEKIQKELEDTKKLLVASQDKTKELEDKLAELDGQSEELASLREFKASTDEKAEAEKALATIKDKFSTAGIKKDDEYFSENKDMLLALSEDALEFMLQEMVSFASEEEDKEGDDDSLDIPNLRNKKTEKDHTPSLIAKKLKERGKSQ